MMLDQKIAKTINQILENILSQAMCLSIFILLETAASFNTCALDEWDEWVNKWSVGFLYSYKLVGDERRCLFNGRADFSFWVVRITLICLGDDFLICILHLGFDQSAKGDKNISCSYTIFQHSLLTRRIFFIFWHVTGCHHQLNNIIGAISSTG